MYQRGKIYRIVCNTTGLQYFGSTCEKSLCRRLSKHKASYNRYLKGKCRFVTSFEIFKNNNYEIILIENYPCNFKDELHQRERFYIENNECVNKFIPCRTTEEYCEVNKDKIIERKKKYREKNKDKISEWHKQNYQQNKEDILERQKKYYEENKEKINEKHRKHREKQKLLKNLPIL